MRLKHLLGSKVYKAKISLIGCNGVCDCKRVCVRSFVHVRVLYTTYPLSSPLLVVVVVVVAAFVRFIFYNGWRISLPYCSSCRFWTFSLPIKSHSSFNFHLRLYTFSSSVSVIYIYFYINGFSLFIVIVIVLL